MSSRAMPMADRISSLSDTLLSHILSFLPTKEAVATSLLSKRWRPLWPSVSTLHFNDQSYSQNKETYFRFLQLVYTVMLRRDVAQPIERFNLECVSSRCDTCAVDTWVIAAIQGKVKHLSLSLPSALNLLCCILTSTTLVVLKLRGLTVKPRVSYVYLPSLKTLHLRRVRFLERRRLLQILSACPVLEDLFIRSLRFTLFNGEQLKILPKLPVVKADISNSSIDIQMATFYNVEFLRTQVTFLNLTYVELIFRFSDWGLLIKLLHQCPNLQSLVVDKENRLIKASSGISYPQFVPKCLSTQLKRCCVKKYGGQESELQFARYILQNAIVLCTLTIYSMSSSNSEERLQMIKKLSSCPRISVTCELSFE